MASGIDTSTIRVERHEPRNIRIMAPVSAAAMMPSRTTSEMAPDTKTDWSNSGVIFMSGGAAARIVGRKLFTLSTTDKRRGVAVLQHRFQHGMAPVRPGRC